MGHFTSGRSARKHLKVFIRKHPHSRFLPVSPHPRLPHLFVSQLVQAFSQPLRVFRAVLKPDYGSTSHCQEERRQALDKTVNLFIPEEKGGQGVVMRCMDYVLLGDLKKKKGFDRWGDMKAKSPGKSPKFSSSWTPMQPSLLRGRADGLPADQEFVPGAGDCEVMVVDSNEISIVLLSVEMEGGDFKIYGFIWVSMWLYIAF